MTRLTLTLAQAAEEAAKRRDKEVVQCPECETEVLKDSFEDAIEVAIDHDEQRHGGAGITLINGMAVPSDKVADAAEDVLEKIKEETK